MKSVGEHVSRYRKIYKVDKQNLEALMSVLVNQIRIDKLHLISKGKHVKYKRYFSFKFSYGNVI